MKNLFILIIGLSLGKVLSAQTYESVNRSTYSGGTTFGPSVDFTKFIFSGKQVVIVNSNGDSSTTYDILYSNESTGFTLIRITGTMKNYEIRVTESNNSNLYTIEYNPSPNPSWNSIYTALKKAD